MKQKNIVKFPTILAKKGTGVLSEYLVQPADKEKKPIVVDYFTLCNFKTFEKCLTNKIQ